MVSERSLLVSNPLKKLLKTTSSLWEHSPAERLGFLSQKGWHEVCWDWLNLQPIFTTKLLFIPDKLVSLNCSVFLSSLFSWPWFTWKAWLSLTEPSANEEILQESNISATYFGVTFIPSGVLLMGWIIDPDLLWTHWSLLGEEILSSSRKLPFFAVWYFFFHVVLPTGVTEENKGMTKYNK